MALGTRMVRSLNWSRRRIARHNHAGHDPTIRVTRGQIWFQEKDMSFINLVPRACDPWEGNEGSGIIRFREESDWPLK
jgi:hypothetical protein